MKPFYDFGAAIFSSSLLSNSEQPESVLSYFPFLSICCQLCFFPMVLPWQFFSWVLPAKPKKAVPAAGILLTGRRQLLVRYDVKRTFAIRFALCPQIRYLRQITLTEG